MKDRGKILCPRCKVEYLELEREVRKNRCMKCIEKGGRSKYD